MTIGHFTLTDEQPCFKAMLAAYRRLMPFLNFEQRECDIEVLRSALGAMSSGEQIMARFIAAVWTGENVLGFNLMADPLFP